MRPAFLVHALLAVALGSVARAAQDDVFTSKTFGFEITKPATWYYISAPQYLDNVRSTKLNDADLQASIIKYATAPLVSVAKSSDPTVGVSAVFKVQVKPSGPLKDQPPTALIAAVLRIAQKAFK